MRGVKQKDTFPGQSRLEHRRLFSNLPRDFEMFRKATCHRQAGMYHLLNLVFPVKAGTQRRSFSSAFAPVPKGPLDSGPRQNEPRDAIVFLFGAGAKKGSGSTLTPMLCYRR